LPPRKHKDLIPKAAELLQKDPTFVRDCVDFYWKEIRQSASKLKGPLILIHNFGYFSFRLARAKENLTVYKAAAEKYSKMEPTFRNHAILSSIKERISQIEKCIVLKEEEIEKFKRIAKEKADEESEKNIRKPEEDI